MNYEKIDRGVLQIFRLTQIGELVWQRKQAPHSLSLGTDSVFPYYFESRYQDKTLAIFLERHRYALSEADERWAERFKLGLLNEAQELQYEFPSSRVTRDLFEAVRIKESQVEDFLDKLLKSEPQGMKI